MAKRRRFPRRVLMVERHKIVNVKICRPKTPVFTQFPMKGRARMTENTTIHNTLKKGMTYMTITYRLRLLNRSL